MGGVALGDLGFDMGPSGGVSYRYKRGTWPVALRGEGTFTHFSQSPESGGESATLSHFGLSAGVELPLAPATSSLQPYVVAGGGVFRFQASGPALGQSDIAGGVFASTTDVAGFGGAGLRFSRRVFVEARFVSVGDFYSVPLVLGFQF